MNKNRMTLEELKELKPSFENPIELVSDDEHYVSSGSIINVVGIYQDKLVFIDKLALLSITTAANLKYYPTLKKEREKMEFKPYWVDGELRLLNDVFFQVQKFAGSTILSGFCNPKIHDIIPAKGIKSVWRYTDDWSVCDG